MFFKIKKYYFLLGFGLCHILLMTTHAYSICLKGEIYADGVCIDPEKVIFIEPGPTKVIQSKIDSAKPGQYIVFKSGDHIIDVKEGIEAGLEIKNKSSLTLIGEEDSWIRTMQGWVVIIRIKSSNNITIQNLRLSHDVERGYCFGSVIELSDVQKIKIINSILEGSGTEAVVMERASGVEIIDGNAIKNTEGVFSIKDSENISIKHMHIADNDNSGYWKNGILLISDSDNISFVANFIENNENAFFDKILNSSKIEIMGNTFVKNNFKPKKLKRADRDLLDFSQVSLTKENIKEKRWSNGIFVGSNFNSQQLYGANFNGASLFYADLRKCGLGDAKFLNAYLRNADLTESYLLDANFNEANLADAILNNAELSFSQLNNANLHSASLQNATLFRAYLARARLDKAQLQNANLKYANLENASLRYADLRKANLSYANLEGARLDGADLTEAVFTGANLRGSVLDEAILVNSNLTGATLENAQLIRCQLNDSILTNTDLTNSVFRPRYDSLPDILSLANSKGFRWIRFYNTDAQAMDENGSTDLERVNLIISEISLILTTLRDKFKSFGLREKERETTYLQKKEEQKFAARGTLVERIGSKISWLAFDLTCAYGLKPFRPILIMGILGIIFIFPYWIGLRINKGNIKRAGILIIYDENDNETQQPIKTKDTKNFWQSIHYELYLLTIAAYFSLLSAFKVGWRDVNIGSWIARLQPKDFTLKATGWLRTVSGFQSLLSVYLIALTVLSFFGRPFDW